LRRERFRSTKRVMSARANTETIEGRLALFPERGGPTIDPNIYGHFAEHLGRCVDEGIWVGEGSGIPNVRGIRSDVVAALKELAIPVLRWPGGCFADEYHWRSGVGPREQRPRAINTHWGGVIETHQFGTHEFMDLCEQIGAAPYVCGNVGSGSVEEMMQWVEYMTSAADSTMADLRRAHGRAEPWRLPYFGVGNESWGCGGSMRPEYYADNYRRYATFVKDYSGNRVMRVACGASGADYEWTETLMKLAARNMGALSLHYYTVPSGEWNRKGSATGFGEDEWHSTLRRTLVMDSLIARHSEIMDRYDPERRVGLIVDEWGTWYDPEPGHNPGFLYQQNTLRDALVAALNFNIFHAHADRVMMANIAQAVNVLQALILTRDEKMVLTPTYHAFEMYKLHQGAEVVPFELEAPSYELASESVPALHATASRAASGRLQLSLVNLHATSSASLAVSEVRPLRGRVLTAGTLDAHNRFDEVPDVTPAPFTDMSHADGRATLRLPARSVVVLEEC
jgi:alpha-N-arabinofuranosidase